MQNGLSVQQRPEEPLALDDVADDYEDTRADKYLLFNIGREVYGIGIGFIIEIIELQKITEVPDMPDYIKGVINLRGKIIPAMDLRLRFHIEARRYDDRNCIVIVKVGERPSASWSTPSGKSRTYRPSTSRPRRTSRRRAAERNS